MSSATHSPAIPSAVCNGNVSAEGNKPPPPAFGRPFNEPIEAGPSAIGGALSGLALSDTITPPPECSSSGSTSADLNHNPNISSNGAFRNGKTLCSSVNGEQKTGYRDETRKGNFSRGDNRRQGTHGCRRQELSQNSYGGPNDIWCDQFSYPAFPRVQPRLYMPPLLNQPMYPVPFIGNPLPFIWSAYQGPVGYSYAPLEGYHYPAAYPFQPQAQCLSGPFYGPRQDIYAAPRAYFSARLDNLRSRLRKQIEYYFSSENLCTDYYLKKHMDARGLVPISLIEGFRKVQQLMKERQQIYDSFGFWDIMQELVKPSTNVQFISESLRPSNAVEVQGDKVRKRHEWEKWV